MKRKYFSILLAAMTIAASVNVYAAPSIGQIIPEAPKVVEGNLSNKQESSSIIKSSCPKVSGFKKSDLSDEGKWLYSMLRKKAGLTK